jgi:hypothetical protein
MAPPCYDETTTAKSDSELKLKGHKLMNNEVKTIDIGQGLQLSAMFAQSLRKIGLSFDEAQNLIDKPSVFKSRLKALKDGKMPMPVGSTYRYTVIEKLDVESRQSHRGDDVGEYIKFENELDKRLPDPERISFWDRREPKFVHKCTVLDGVPRQGCLYTLYPILRDVLDWQGPDTHLWGLLGERGALWTPDQVLGFLRDEIHEGNDPLGLIETAGATFPIVWAGEESYLSNCTDPEKVGFLEVSVGSPIRQKTVWQVRARLGPGYMAEFYNKLMFFASDPRQPTKR